MAAIGQTKYLKAVELRDRSSNDTVVMDLKRSNLRNALDSDVFDCHGCCGGLINGYREGGIDDIIVLTLSSQMRGTIPSVPRVPRAALVRHHNPTRALSGPGCCADGVPRAPRKVFVGEAALGPLSDLPCLV